MEKDTNGLKWVRTGENLKEDSDVSHDKLEFEIYYGSLCFNRLEDGDGSLAGAVSGFVIAIVYDLLNMQSHYV